MSRLLPTLLILGLTVYALIDCLQTPTTAVRSLPKPGWLIVIVLVVLIGPVAWLLIGRPREETTGTPASTPRPRPAGPRRTVAPDDDPDFLRGLDRDRRRQRDDELRRWEDDLRRRDDPSPDSGEPGDDGAPRP